MIPRVAPWLPFLLGVAVMPAAADIPSFFQELHSEYQAAYAGKRAEQYADFTLEFALDPVDSTNQRIFHEIGFYHELLTGSGAIDCVSGGALGIPYFWHWVEPNPRHAIVRLPESVPLSSLPPPAGFARYRSYADVDRIPALFLTDLVSTSPRYRHEECGDFFTFGWCSEREMAFLALVTCLGYEGKIRQEEIHSWSELWCTLAGEDGAPVHLIAAVDNTFGTVEWKHAPRGISRPEWLKDIGPTENQRWYNATARSASQHAQLRQAAVPRAAAERIKRQVRAWLEAE